jgi:hypothetical protein
MCDPEVDEDSKEPTEPSKFDWPAKDKQKWLDRYGDERNPN